jgi:hypothetical protein
MGELRKVGFIAVAIVIGWAVVGYNVFRFVGVERLSWMAFEILGRSSRPRCRQGRRSCRRIWQARLFSAAP